LRAHQAGLLDTLLPRLSIALDRPAPPDLRSLFGRSVENVQLEVGFGGGEHLSARAAAEPGNGFIGSEGYVNAVAKILVSIESRKLENVRLHLGDAADLIAWLPDHSLARIDLLYPDPWPKRRHWKRRFIQDESLKEFARILRPNGTLRFATDIDDYAGWALACVLRSEAFEWAAAGAADWRNPWEGYTGTRYEAKARREGRQSSYLIFRRR
jgi:tRNA (guanine-N7-)-methyltransferase